MNKIELCLQNKIVASNNKLQPTIFKAILNLYQQGSNQITAKMTTQECVKIDQNTDWAQRLKAICNSMGRTIECGAVIISENRPHNNFTIAFNGDSNDLEIHNPKNKSTKEQKKPFLQPKTPENKNNNIQEKLNLSKIFKVVMACANGKYKSFFLTYPNINFEAISNAAVGNYHPDDEIGSTKISFREYLINNQNDTNLLRAYQLYTRNEYQCLYNKFRNSFYILSAGWGLVNSEFKLPKYDITFSNSAQPRTKRNNDLFIQPIYHDFSQLNVNDDEDIVFIGSADYIPLFIHLTQNVNNRKIIYWKKMLPEPTPIKFPIPNNTFLYRFYNTRTNTNWYYEIARDLCNGIIP